MPLNFYTRNTEKHTEDQVETVIKAFPSALSHLDRYGRLPIQTAPYYDRCIPFVTLLAGEGVKLKVGGEGKRGGLLVDVPDSPHEINLLQLLSASTADDSVILDVIKKLRESKLFLKEDVSHYQLLYWSCYPLLKDPSLKDRFDYFIGWDPEALKNTLYAGNPLLQAFVLIENFAMMLKAGMKHYPEHLGFLFRKNSAGKTACEAAFAKYGKGETFKVI